MDIHYKQFLCECQLLKQIPLTMFVNLALGKLIEICHELSSKYQNDDKAKFRVLPGQVLIIVFETKTDF